MKSRVYIPLITLLLVLLCPLGVVAVEVAPRISDREIIERLTTLEGGQKHLEAKIEANADAIAQLRSDMHTQFDRIEKQFDRIEKQFDRIEKQFDRIDAQFDRLFQLTLGILGAFAAIVAATIGFALWDRRTMIRPFESKVKEIEEDLTKNREHLHSLLEALRSLGQSDEKVAEVLRQFRLL